MTPTISPKMNVKAKVVPSILRDQDGSYSEHAIILVSFPKITYKHSIEIVYKAKALCTYIADL